MANEHYETIGADARNRVDNLFIREFAAHLIGESYPLSEECTKIVLDSYKDDETLGRRICEYMDSHYE